MSAIPIQGWHLSTETWPSEVGSLHLPIWSIYLPFQVNLYVPNSKPLNNYHVLYARIAHVSIRAVCIFHVRRVILKRSGLRSSFTRKWLVTGMPSSVLKSNQNNCKQKSPRTVVSWRHPLFRASHGLMIVGGGGVKTLPFYLGTAYNVCSMEDIGNSWLLCWQWKHTSQNYFHLYFKTELWHLYKSLLPSAKGLSIYFYVESSPSY